MSSESEQEAQLQEQLEAVKEAFFRHLKYFLENDAASELFDGLQRLKRSAALFKINSDPSKFKFMLFRAVSLEKQPTLKLFLESYNGEDNVNVPLSSIEAHEIISNLTPADYAVLCEHGAREYIEDMEKRIAKLTGELDDPEISTEDEQVVLQLRDVDEHDKRVIERYLEGILHGTNTDWRRKCPLYSEIGGE